MKLPARLALLFYFGISISTKAQTLDNIPLINNQSILNNKAFFLFPANAINSNRATDIMAPEINNNDETRIVFDIDQMRMVFFARDLYSKADKDLLQAVSKKNGSDKYKTKVLLTKDSVLAIMSTPLIFDSTKSAILINDLIVKTQDNSVFSISVYINPAAYKNKDDFQRLSERVFGTLLKGSRRLNIQAKQEFISINSKKKFTVSLPDNYFATKDRGSDFNVYRIKKINNYSDSNWSEMTIYIGDHPSYFFPDYGFTQKQLVKLNDIFAGIPFHWISFANPGKHLYLREQQIPINQIENGLIVHIALVGSNQKSINDLTALVKKIKIIDQ